MRNTHEAQIDGNKYTFKHLPATEAWRIHQRLLGIAGKPLAAGILSLHAVKSLDEGVPDSLENVIAELVENVAKEENEKLMKDLMKCIRVTSETGHEMDVDKIFDTHFSGRIATVWKVLIEQVKFQFEDVFLVLVERIGQAAARFKSIAQATSFGQPGDSSSVKKPPSSK